MTNVKSPVKVASPMAPAAGVASRKSAAPATAAREAKHSPAVPVGEPRAAAASKTVVTAPSASPKSKLVRDSFTIPKSEYAVLDALKLRATRLMRPTKKSEVLRAGIAALAAMNDAEFLASITIVPSLKTGRPKASHVATKQAPK